MNGHSSFPILQESHKKHCGQLSVISQAKEALNGIGPSLRPCQLSRVKSPHKHDARHPVCLTSRPVCVDPGLGASHPRPKWFTSVPEVNQELIDLIVNRASVLPDPARDRSVNGGGESPYLPISHPASCPSLPIIRGYDNCPLLLRAGDNNW